MAKLFDKKVIIEATLNPSAGIAMGYDATVITTKRQEERHRLCPVRGRSHADQGPGRQSDQYRREAHRQHHQTQDISHARRQCALGLSAQDLADVVAFLISIRPAD